MHVTSTEWPEAPNVPRRPRFSLRALLIITTLVAAALGYFVVRARSHTVANRRHWAIVDQLRANAGRLPTQRDFGQAAAQSRQDLEFPPADVDATLARFGARIRSSNVTNFTVDFSRTRLANRPNAVAELLADHMESGLPARGLTPLKLMAVGRRIWTGDDLVVSIDVVIPATEQKAYVRVLLVDTFGAD